MTVDTERQNYTIEEYLEIEEESIEKLEYYNGKIKPMPGGTPVHNEIALKAGAALLQIVKKLERRYKVYNSDMKIWIGENRFFVYPDAVVVCEKPALYEGRKDIITNPLLIVEVLSPSTEGYDRSGKFLHYAAIPTFREYVLLWQNRIQGDVYFREEEDLWRKKRGEEMDGILPLRSLGAELPLAGIYEDVDLEESLKGE